MVRNLKKYVKLDMETVARNLSLFPPESFQVTAYQHWG